MYNPTDLPRAEFNVMLNANANSWHNYQADDISSFDSLPETRAGVKYLCETLGLHTAPDVPTMKDNLSLRSLSENWPDLEFVRLYGSSDRGDALCGRCTPLAKLVHVLEPTRQLRRSVVSREYHETDVQRVDSAAFGPHGCCRRGIVTATREHHRGTAWSRQVHILHAP
jgi:hypothetical protein